MDSDVGICNAALTILGTRNIMMLTEDSNEAKKCNKVFWDCVETTLQEYKWSFATTQVELAPLTDKYVGWNYAYQYPKDCLQRISLINPNEDEDWHYPILSSEFTVELSANNDSRVLLTDHERVIIKYTKFIKNINVYTPTFKRALVWQLAITLGRSLKGAASNEVAACMQSYREVISKAKVIDANESIIKPVRKNKYLEGRR